MAASAPALSETGPALIARNRPQAVAQLTADFRRQSGEPLPLSYDSSHTLDFQTTAGHRYLVIGIMEADASNGGRVVFDNSFRLTGVAAPTSGRASPARRA